MTPISSVPSFSVVKPWRDVSNEEFDALRESADMEMLKEFDLAFVERRVEKFYSSLSEDDLNKVAWGNVNNTFFKGTMREVGQFFIMYERLGSHVRDIIKRAGPEGHTPEFRATNPEFLENVRVTSDLMNFRAGGLEQAVAYLKKVENPPVTVSLSGEAKALLEKSAKTTGADVALSLLRAADENKQDQDAEKDAEKDAKKSLVDLVA